MRCMIRGIAASALIMVLPALAHAHAHLKSATPADKANVGASPAAITLEFSESIEMKFSNAAVTGPGKEIVKTGSATHGKGSEATLEVPLEGALKPGTYTVDWHILSTDGHKTKGSYTFSIKP